MNDLRKAAEALLNHWEAGEYKNCTGDMAGHVRVLRDALVKPEWVGMTDEEIMQPWPDEEKYEFVIMFAKWVEAKLKDKNL